MKSSSKSNQFLDQLEFCNESKIPYFKKQPEPLFGSNSRLTDYKSEELHIVAHGSLMFFYMRFNCGYNKKVSYLYLYVKQTTNQSNDVHMSKVQADTDVKLFTINLPPKYSC